jgi:hypothetical protein
MGYIMPTSNDADHALSRGHLVFSNQLTCGRFRADRRSPKIAKVAMARRLAVRMYWMWRKEWDYEQMKKFGSHAGQPGHRDGVQQNTE